MKREEGGEDGRERRKSNGKVGRRNGEGKGKEGQGGGREKEGEQREREEAEGEERGRKRKGKREREEQGGVVTADGVLLEQETQIYHFGEQHGEQSKTGERVMERGRKEKASEIRSMHEKEVVFFSL